MNKEIKAKWLAALRSGEYRQCFGVLRTDKCFCALGVLADVVDPSGWNRNDNDTVYRYENSCFTLPGKIYWDAAGITFLQLFKIQDMNDKEKKDFDFIAKQIELSL